MIITQADIGRDCLGSDSRFYRIIGFTLDSKTRSIALAADLGKPIADQCVLHFDASTGCRVVNGPPDIHLVSFMESRSDSEIARCLAMQLSELHETSTGFELEIADLICQNGEVNIETIREESKRARAGHA